MNQFILNADDFGMSETFNDAVLEGFKIGLLKSTSLTANGIAFDDAISRIIPQTQGLSVGIHLNIIEGTALSNGLNLLCDNHNEFNNSYISLILKSYGVKRKEFLNQIEQEFRTQIEKILNVYPDISHIDSHVHTHAIPKIFELVCKLAKEYGIPRIRTQFEYPYSAKNHKDWFNPQYYINLIKICILNVFTVINRGTLYKYGLKSNDRVIGVGYTGMMDKDTILSGIEASKDCDCVLEVICHPDLNEERNSNRKEYSAVTDKELQEKIKEYNVITYREL